MKELERETKVGQYKIGFAIAREEPGFRNVYLAYDESQNPVILYCFKNPILLESEDVLNPRLDEYYMYVRHSLDILPEMLSRGEDENFVWVAVKYISAYMPLSVYVRQHGPLPVNVAIAIFLSLIDAIIERGMESNGGFNCICPENLLLVSEEGNISKWYVVGTRYVGLEGSERIDRLCSHIAHNYRAPEIDYGAASYISDVFSTGMLLYFMLTGRDGDALIDNFDYKCLDNPHIISIIQGCLNKDPIGRQIFILESLDALVGDANQYVEEMKRKGFAAVAGLDELKKKLRRDFIELIKHCALAEAYNLKPHNGWLFYGPPGCGKSYIAEALAQECGLNFKMIRPSDIGSKYMHESKGLIAKIFDEAAAEGNTVICLDEADALFPRRDTPGINEYLASEVNEFLIHLNNCADRGVYVIALTNCPDKIDPAVLRTGRIEARCYIPLPDFQTREQLFALYLSRLLADPDIALDDLAHITDGYTCSDIAYVVREAARKTFDECMRKNTSDPLPINQRTLLQVIRDTPSSVTPSERDRYEVIHQEFEGRQLKSKIGYKISL